MLEFKKWPGYAPASHWLYKLEHALASLALLAALHLASIRAGLDLAPTAFFLLAPDLPLVAIVLASRKGKWPPWGSNAYNFTHNFAVWLAALAVALHLTGTIYWPVFAWALHITLDRTIGFNLRSEK